MITAENLERVWKNMREFEREHFGLRFGEDFAEVAKLLGESKEFMSVGSVLILLAGLEMSAMSQRMREAGEAEKRHISRGLLEKPGMIHGTLAEVFYAGYQLGRSVRESDILEKMQGDR